MSESESTTPEPDDLMVWYVPQVPGPAFEVRVPDLKTASLVLEVITDLSAFEFDHNIKPDYSDASGISRWEPNGDDGFDWYEVEQEKLDEAVRS